jgi:hypothetical protein
MRCQVCEWRGDGGRLPRKILIPHDGPSKYQLRKAGQLFFVRIECARVPSERLISGIMTALKINSMSCGSRHVLIEMETRPTEEQVNTVRRLRGIRKVEAI